MKAICFHDVERVTTQEVPDPEIQASTDAIVEVTMAGLCGSDLHAYHGRETGLDRGTIMGHEFVGTVIATGTAVCSLQVGDRVASPFTTCCGKCFYCRNGLTSRCERGELFGWRRNGCGLHGGQAERVRVALADTTLVKLDETLSDTMALLLGDNLGTAFYSTDMAEVRSERTCGIIGCGTVGLLAIHAARQKGADRIFAVDLIPERRALAQSLGAIAMTPDTAVAQILEATEGRGVDSVIELVGLPPAQSLAYRMVRAGGILAAIGCNASPQFSFTPAQAYDKNLTIRTGRCPARVYMERTDELVPSIDALTQQTIEGLVTHTFDISQSVSAYETFAGRMDGCIKAAIVFPTGTNHGGRVTRQP